MSNQPVSLETQVNYYLQQGQELENNGQLEQAIASYRQAIDLAPSNSQANQTLAEALKKQGNFSEAIYFYQQALTFNSLTNNQENNNIQLLNKETIKNNPINEQNLINQAYSFYEQKKWSETIKLGQKILEINPNLAEIYKLLGNSLQQLGEHNQALAFYSRALNIKPDFADVYANIGSIYARQKNWQQALKYYQQAVKFNPQLAAVYRNIAKIFRENGQNDQALQAIYQATLIEPEKTSPQEYYSLANYLLKQNKINEAISCLETAIKLKPDYLESYQKITEIFQQQGNWEAAGNYARKMIELQQNIAPQTAQEKVQILAQKEAEKLENLPQQNTVRKVINESEIWEKTQSFYEQKQWENTINGCQKLIENNPNFAEAYKLWGTVLQQLGKLEEALNLYHKALNINPNFAEVYANIGSIYARKKNWQQALNCYQKAVNINPKLAAVYRNIAKILRENGQNDQALQAIYQATLIEPEKTSPQDYYSLADFFLKQNQINKAISCLQKAVEFYSDFLQGYQKLADIAQQQGNWDLAGTYYQKIIELQAQKATQTIKNQVETAAKKLPSQIENKIPQLTKEKIQENLAQETSKLSQQMAILNNTNSAEILLNLGNKFAQEKQYSVAIAAYKKALEINPKLSAVYRNLAIVYEAINQIETAAEYWYQTYQLEPQTITPENYYNLGNIFLKQRKVPQALNCYRQSINIAPKFSPSYHQLGIILIQNKNLEEAKKIFQQAIKENPNDAQSYVYLSEIFGQENEIQKAIDCCLQALKIDPENWQAYHNLGNFYLKQPDNWEKAANSFRQAININPNFSWSHHNLGEVCLNLGYYQEAIESLKRAIAINPNSPWSYYNLGEALTKLHKWEQAAEAYNQAKTLDPHLPYIEEKEYEALAKFNQLTIEEAFNTYLEEIKENPNDIESYYKGLEIKPDNLELKIGLGKALIANKKFEEAVSYWQKILREKPDLLEGYINLATALEFLGKKEESLTYQEKIFRLSNFDYQLYIELYPNLNLSTPETAYSHWLHIGQEEERIYNQGQLFKSYGFVVSDLPNNFDWQEYLQLNPDLLSQGIKTKWTAIKHFLSQGLLEGRKYSQNLSDSWRIYLKLGDNLKIQGKVLEAIFAYNQSIFHNPKKYRSYQHLGDALLSLGKLEEAGNAYSKAIELNPHSFWATNNLASVYQQKKRWFEALKYYHQAIKINPLVTLPLRQLKDALNHQWNEGLMQIDYYLNQDKYQKATQILRQSIHDYQNNQYLPEFTNIREIPEKPAVLLIVNDFIPQCLHYRIEQKIEQLEYAGFPVEWIASRHSSEAKNKIHFAHVIIFYRVPALPEMIELISYAKTINKVVFYEIDDLIFDEQYYPDPFESYGGQINKQEYFGLIRGTTLFKEAMAMADYGIVSTPTLKNAMEKVENIQKVWVHRNALDSQNIEFLRLKVAKIKRDYISIFYGTGTKAHNADFDDLVAPALAKILHKYPNVRLTIVGYLTLPKILQPYQKQVDKVPVIKNISVYWEFLKQADINIAVLKDTEFNNGKSELKWFEAASLGVPSIVSNTTTYLEVIEDGKDGVIAKNPQEWQEKLELLINDEQLRLSIAKTAYKKVWKTYNIPVMANNIKQIIEAGMNEEIMAGKLVKPEGKIKLLIVNVFYPPQSIGGATRVVKDNVDIFQEKYGDKYEISIFTTDNDNPIPYQINEYSHEDIWVTKVSTPMQEKMDWQYQNPQIYDIFKDYLEFNKPDLIHFHCIQRLTGSVLEAAADLKIPYCVTVHDAWWISDHQFLVNEKGEECDYQQSDPLITVRNTDNLTDSLARRRYLQQRLNHAGKVLAVSEAFTELYHRNGIIKTQPNRNGIIPKPKLPRQPNPNNKVRLAHVGGISAHKGYNLLEQVIKTNSFPNLELVVIDHGESSNQVIRREHWNQTVVTFNGKIHQEEMYKFYSTIDVLIAASIWPESFGLVTREAAAAGVWVVASNKGALAEDLEIGVNGDVFNPENPEELTAILQRINDHPAQYQELITADITIRTVEKQVDELDAIYATVLPKS